MNYRIRLDIIFSSFTFQAFYLFAYSSIIYLFIVYLTTIFFSSYGAIHLQSREMGRRGEEEGLGGNQGEVGENVWGLRKEKCTVGVVLWGGKRVLRGTREARG